MDNRRRRKKKQTGRRELVIFAISIAAFIAAMAWKVPGTSVETIGATTEQRTHREETAVATITAEPTEEPESTEQAEPKKTYVGTFTVTAYCSCEICCGEYANNRPNGIVYTASGAEAEEGVTVGASWDVLPAGTHIEIEGLGERIVQDRPADWIVERYDGMIIDAYFEDHEAALEYGKQTVDVWIIEDTDGKEE